MLFASDQAQHFMSDQKQHNVTSTSITTANPYHEHMVRIVI